MVSQSAVWRACTACSHHTIKFWGKRIIANCLVVLFCDRVSLCSPGWPQIHGNPSASAFWVLGLQALATMPSCQVILDWRVRTCEEDCFGILNNQIFMTWCHNPLNIGRITFSSCIVTTPTFWLPWTNKNLNLKIVFKSGLEFGDTLSSRYLSKPSVSWNYALELSCWNLVFGTVSRVWPHP